jgi:tetratricopeptide (TPR) repeat protein
VWGPALHVALRDKLATADPSQGANRFARAASLLDARAQAWSEMHVAACRATRVEGRQSDTLLDRRMACLDRWLDELGATAAVLANADRPAAVDQAIHAVTSMSPLDACADLHALAAEASPPTGPGRAVAAELTARTRELAVAERAGRFDGLIARAAELVRDARALGHPPTLADALAEQIRILEATGDDGPAEPLMRELVEVAARAHDDRNEAFAWLGLISTIATTRGKPDEALALVPSAHAAVLRGGDPVDRRADLLYTEGVALDQGPRAADGLARLTEARQLLEGAGGESPTSPHAGRLTDILLEIGTSQMRSGDLTGSAATLRHVIDRWRAISGPDSADEAYGWHNLSAVLEHADALDDALAAAREAVRIRQARLGAAYSTALSLTQEAEVLDDQSRWDVSIGIYDRALQMSRATLSPGDLQLANPLIGRALAQVHLERYAAAARDYDEAIALFEHAGSKTINLGIAVYNRGDLAAHTDRCGDAIRDYARALAVFEAVAGPTSHLLIYPLAGEGACLVRSRRAAEAIPLLERALAQKPEPSDGFDVARAQAYLGWAQVETGRDRAGGLALVRTARPAIAASPEHTDELRRLDAWLAGHPR